MINFIKKQNNKAVDIAILGTLLILIFATLMSMIVDGFINTIAKQHVIATMQSAEKYALTVSHDEAKIEEGLLEVDAYHAESVFRSEIASRIRVSPNSYFKTVEHGSMIVRVGTVGTEEAYIYASLAYTPKQFIKSPADFLFPIDEVPDNVDRYRMTTNVATHIYIY